MRAWSIDIPKPPEDVWRIEVDFTGRLDVENGEELAAATVEVYKLWGYHEVVEEYDLTDATRLNLEIEKYGGVEAQKYSYPVVGQPSAELRFPKDYGAEHVPGMVLPESITIGPASGSPPNTRISFDVRGGEDDTWYAIYVGGETNEHRYHSCVIRLKVKSISLTE